MGMRRVGYDAQAFLSPNGGTGKGLQLRNLLGPYVDSFTGFASTGPNPSGMRLVQEGAAGYNLWQQFSLPGSLRRHRIELFLAPSNTAPLLLPRRTELILVLHDLILRKGFRKPDRKGRRMDAYRRWQIGPSVRRAGTVLTVSAHARAEILEAFPRADVQVIPCTIGEEWFRPRPLEGRAGYLLMVTSSAPHKNAPGAIEAYARYAQGAGESARPLRIVGMAKEAGAYQAMLRSYGVAGLVSFLPFVTEAQLLELYLGAGALLFPSFAEGFGIPMLEAMATGTPVIASSATSLPEVGGAAACYFDPLSMEEAVAALERVLGDDALREAMAQKGIERARVYHPEVVGRQVVAFWERVAAVEPVTEVRAAASYAGS